MKISGEEIAQRAGIAYSTYSNIEKGKSKPTLETAMKIANVLNVQVETIFKLGNEDK